MHKSAQGNGPVLLSSEQHENNLPYILQKLGKKYFLKFKRKCFLRVRVRVRVRVRIRVRVRVTGLAKLELSYAIPLLGKLHVYIAGHHRVHFVTILCIHCTIKCTKSCGMPTLAKISYLGRRKRTGPHELEQWQSAPLSLGGVDTTIPDYTTHLHKVVTTHIEGMDKLRQYTTQNPSPTVTVTQSYSFESHCNCLIRAVLSYECTTLDSLLSILFEQFQTEVLILQLSSPQWYIVNRFLAFSLGKVGVSGGLTSKSLFQISSQFPYYSCK